MRARAAIAVQSGDLSGVLEDHSDDAEKRLRLTLGLRKEQDRWVVAHEHHSFADTD